MPGEKPNKREMQERIEDTEAHLVRLRSSRRTELAIAEKYGISRRTVRRYIRKVYDIWEDESAEEGPRKRQRLRSDYRNVLNEVLASAMNKATTITDDNGNQRRVPDPDVRSALRAVEQLRKLDAVDVVQVQKIEGKIDGDVGLSDFVAAVMKG